MIGETLRYLRYPIADDFGRTMSLVIAAAVVAIAIGVRYAVVFVPSAVALVPATVAVLALVALLGTASLVLVSVSASASDTGERRSPPSLRATLRPGLGALALSIVVLVPPIALLISSVTQATAGRSAEGGPALFVLVSSTASIFFFAACAYVYPVAVAASTSAGRTRAAFETDAVRPVLTDPSYFLHWSIGFPLVVVAAWLAVTTVTSGGAVDLLAAVGAAYFLVAGARTVGAGYARASGDASADPSERPSAT